MDEQEFTAMVAGLYRDHHMTQEQIASRAGVSTNTVWRALNGQLRFPAHATIEKLKTLAAEVERDASKHSNRRQGVS